MRRNLLALDYGDPVVKYDLYSGYFVRNHQAPSPRVILQKVITFRDSYPK